MTPNLPPGPAVAPDEDLLDVAELLRTLNRYKWSIVGISILAALLAGFYGFSKDKYYRATATVLIESMLPRAAPVAEVAAPPDLEHYDEYAASQFEILRSRSLISKVVDKLGLVDNPEFAPVPPSLLVQFLNWRNWLPLGADDAPVLTEEEQRARRRDAVIDAFGSGEKAQGLLSIEPLRGTQLVRVHFKSRDPALAAQVVNTLTDLFIEDSLQARLDVTTRASRWLTGKLGDIRAQLETSERALQEFRDREHLVDVGGTRTLSEDELLDATKRLREAQKRKTELASAYARVREAGDDPALLAGIPALVSDPRVTTASKGFLEAQEALKQVRERYGEKHPAMAAAKARYDAAHNAYADALRVAAQGVKSDYEIASANEKALSDVVATSRGTIQKLDRKQYQMSVLEREVATNQDIYNMFLKRFKETDSTNHFENLVARVVDPAVTPRVPYEPKVRRMVVIGGAAGLLLALVITLLRHLLSEEVRSAEELELLTQLPVVGVVPKVSKGEARALPKMFLSKPQTPYSEGIRGIRTALQLSDVGKKYHRLLITSSVPQEGKSSLACSLAQAFAMVEQTLLVDTDLRRPVLAKALGVPAKRPGLTEVLAGQARLEDCLFLQEQSGLYLLPAGGHVPNPAEILGSLAFSSLLEELSRRFNRILFDTPPCHATVDALLLSQHMDGVLFVVKSGGPSRRLIKNSFRLLRNVGAPVLGNVVCQLDAKKSGSGYPGYFTYGYYAGGRADG